MNTNADTIAATLGENLCKTYEVSIHYCFELTGVLKELNNQDSVIEEITSSNFQTLKDSGAISTGMIPKLYNAFNGLEKGVKTVTIGNCDHFTGKQPFTTISL